MRTLSAQRCNAHLVTWLAALLPLGAAAQANRAPEPHVQQTVLQDESVRIEELRVRGLNTSLVVKPKNAAEYEVVPAPGGRDPSQGRLGSQGAAGQRVWNVLKF